jgi:hypothetical protein
VGLAPGSAAPRQCVRATLVCCCQSVSAGLPVAHPGWLVGPAPFGYTRSLHLPLMPTAGIRIRDRRNGEVSDLAVNGLFFAIGESSGCRLV